MFQPVISNFRATQSLPDYLKSQHIVAIAGIDTRKLTRILREKGAQNGAIVTGNDGKKRALELARACAGLSGQDLAKTVTADRPYEWTEAGWELGSGYRQLGDSRYHVVRV